MIEVSQLYQQLKSATDLWEQQISGWKDGAPIPPPIFPEQVESIRSLFTSTFFRTYTIPRNVGLGGKIIVISTLTIGLPFVGFQITAALITTLACGILLIAFEGYHIWKRNKHWKLAFQAIEQGKEVEAITHLLKGAPLNREIVVYSCIKFTEKTNLSKAAANTSSLAMLLFLTLGHRSIGLPYYPSAVVSSTNSLKTALFLITLTEETKRKNLDRSLYFPLSLSMSNETLKELIDAGVDVNAQRGDGSSKYTIASWAFYHCIIPFPLENPSQEELSRKRTRICETASILGVNQSLIDSLPKEFEAFKTEISKLFPNLSRDTIDGLHQVLIDRTK